MTSLIKSATNKTGGKKSPGPKTGAGKMRSRRNAVKHEITSTKSRGPEFTGRLMQIAEAICGDGTSPELALYAGRIAEAELLLQVIRTQRVSIIDRLRHPFLEPLVKGDRTVAVMEKFIAQADLADGEYSQLIDQMQKNKETFFAPWPPRKLEPNEPAWKYEEAKDRDEDEAMDAALPDLERLLRYERRILSRRKRAVLDLIAYNFAEAEAKDQST
jgi:hypothetical protein